MRAAFFVFIGLSFVGSVYADDVKTITLQELFAELEVKNPTIASAQSYASAAGLLVDRAKALPDPQISFMVEDVSISGEPLAPMFRLQASQMLMLFGKRDAMAKAAQKRVDVFAARVDTAKLDITAEVKALYYRLYLNQRERSLNQEQHQLLETLTTLATAQVSAGMPMHHDVLKMQTEVAMLEDELLMLTAERKEMAAMLGGLLGRSKSEPIGEPVESWTRPQSFTLEALVSVAMQSRPELKEMQAMEGEERAMAESFRRALYPDLMVGAFYDSYVGEGDMIGFMTGVTLPVYANVKQRPEQRAAELRADATKQKRSAMEAMVRAEIDASLSMLTITEDRIKLLDGKFLPLAQQTFDAALATYPTGGSDALAVLDALRMLIDQQRALTRLKVQRELALISLTRSVGASLEDSP